MEIRNAFGFLGPELVDELLKVSTVKDFPKNTELIREGQYVSAVPIVMKGLVKVFTRQEDKELLLYYIQPKESCIMSFSACLKRDKSRIFAITEEDSTVILLPADQLSRWVTEYPMINRLFYQQFDLRYSELIYTINSLLYDKLDKRLFDFLNGRVVLTGKNPIKISHKEIAYELGTAREVVSRLVKKLERENKIRQHSDRIEILPAG